MISEWPILSSGKHYWSNLDNYQRVTNLLVKLIGQIDWSNLDNYYRVTNLSPLGDRYEL